MVVQVTVGVIWLLCAIDAALGLWLAYVFAAAAIGSGAGRLMTPDNVAYMLLTTLLLIAPWLCGYLRSRASLAARMAIAALPIAVFLTLGGRLWVRLV